MQLESFNNQLVDGKQLLETLFPESVRPSLRWLHRRKARREVPYVQLGRLIFYDPEQVRRSIAERMTVRARAPRRRTAQRQITGLAVA